MAHPVVHFEVMGKDADALSSFYKSAFGWQSTDFAGTGTGDIPKYLVIRPTGEEEPKFGINGGIGAVPAGDSGYVTFYVAVDDIGKTFELIESLGGKCVMGPHQVPDGPLIGLFTDPEGHTIGLVQPDETR